MSESADMMRRVLLESEELREGDKEKIETALIASVICGRPVSMYHLNVVGHVILAKVEGGPYVICPIPFMGQQENDS